MRSTLLDYLPADLRARRVLDAGCGTGAFSAAAADRGARVIAIDLSGTLIALARERLGAQLRSGRVEYRVGDMSDPALGRFDHVVAMDSLIHYPPRDVVRVLALWAARTTHSILFTFAPSTPALAAMHAIGRCFPRRERAPAIEPIAQRSLFQLLTGEARLAEWHVARTQRIESGFYTSQAVELVRR
jgi:magnesium-protoporphyrin O-methyltransferase